jgi:hypothetical protein
MMSFPFYQVVIWSKRIAELQGYACADDASVRYHTETMVLAKRRGSTPGLSDCHQGLTASTQNPFPVSTAQPSQDSFGTAKHVHEDVAPNAHRCFIFP